MFPTGRDFTLHYLTVALVCLLCRKWQGSLEHLLLWVVFVSSYTFSLLKRRYKSLLILHVPAVALQSIRFSAGVSLSDNEWWNSTSAIWLTEWRKDGLTAHGYVSTTFEIPLVLSFVFGSCKSSTLMDDWNTERRASAISPYRAVNTLRLSYKNQSLKGSCLEK